MKTLESYKNLFYIGKIVKGKNFFSQKFLPWNGCLGKIVSIDKSFAIDTWLYVGVSFEKEAIFGGHTCEGLCSESTGRYFTIKLKKDTKVLESETDFFYHIEYDLLNTMIEALKGEIL